MVTLKITPKKTFPESLSLAIKIFTRDEETRTETQHIREEDPTTLEFQKLFREILSKAQSDTTKIVIVFDNIDRLQREKVVSAWAEVRSIFTETHPSIDDAMAAITVIVPYDVELISDAFDDGDIAVNTAQTYLDVEGGPHRSQAKDLIEKTFDVTIKVSPPLSLDWQKFLNSKIDKAFHHNVADETRWRLFRLFDLHCQQNGTYPTPRLIIAYVNAIGTLWNQWHSDISLESMALYVLFRQEIESSPKMLKLTMPIHERFIQVAQQDKWRRHISAIHFNVNTEIAYQVLAGTDIGGALETENLKQLDELQRLEFFEGVLVDVVSDSASNWARDGVESFSAIIRALTHVDSESEAVSHSWKLLIGVLNELQSIDVREENDSTSLAMLLKHCERSETKDVGRHLLQKAAAGLPEASKRLVKDGMNWARFVDAALAKANEDDHQGIYRRDFLPDGVEFVLGVAVASEVYEHIDFNDFLKQEPDGGLASLAIELAASNPGYVKSFATTKPKFFTTKTESSCIDAFVTKLQGEDCGDELVAEMFDALLIVRSIAQNRQHIQNALEGMLADGTLAWYFGKACSNENPVLIGKILFCISEATKGSGAPARITTHSVFGDLNPSYSVLEEVYVKGALTEEVASSIAQEIIRAGSFSTWCGWAIGDEDDGFYQVILRKTAAQPEYRRLNVEKAVTDYPRIHEILDDKVASHYLKLLQGWHALMPESFAGEKILTVPLLFLDHVETFGAPRLRNLVAMLQDHFNGFVEFDWSELLVKNSKGLGHLVYLVEKENYVPPAGEFRSALKSFANDVIDGEVDATSYEKELDILAEGLAPATRAKFFSDFLRGLKERSVSKEGVNALVQLFPNNSRKLPFAKHPEISIDQIFIPLIWNGFDTGSQFFDNASKQVGQCLKKAGDETRMRFIEAIEGLESSGEDEKMEWAAGLRRDLGFSPTMVRPGEEDQTPEGS